MRIAVTSRSFSKHPILRVELLKRYPEVTFNDQDKKLEGQNLIDYLRGHEKAIIGLEKIDDTVLSQLPELKVISKVGVGLDNISLTALIHYQIALAWKPGVNKRSISELVLAFAIAMLRHLPMAHTALINGCFKQIKGNLLTGKTVGIIGFGSIGKDLATLLSVFDCEILVYDTIRLASFYEAYNVKLVSLERLLINSDVVTLHVPLNDSTRNLISKTRLSLMKKNAILINTARGGLVDEVALQEMLQEKKLGGAAFDVFSEEPPRNQELLQLPDFFATPHIGGSSEEAILAMGMAAIEGLDCAVIPEVV